jgi:hypothetical protein
LICERQRILLRNGHCPLHATVIGCSAGPHGDVIGASSPATMLRHRPGCWDCSIIVPWHPSDPRGSAPHSACRDPAAHPGSLVGVRMDLPGVLLRLHACSSAIVRCRVVSITRISPLVLPLAISLSGSSPQLSCTLAPVFPDAPGLQHTEKK